MNWLAKTSFNHKFFVTCTGGVLSFIIAAFVSVPSAQAAIDWTQCRTEVATTQIPASQVSVDHTLTTSITDTSKAFVLHNSTGTNTTQGANDHFTTGFILDANTLRFERVASPNAPAEISYTVVECFNDEFTVQTGEITLGNGVQTNTDTITAVDTGTSFPIVTVRTTDTAADQREAKSWADLTNTTTVRVARSGTYTPVVTARYQVVEFSAESGVVVNPVQINFSGAIASATAAIPSSPLDRSFAYCSWDSSSNGLRQNAIGCELTNATTVTAHRHAASNYTNRVQFHVIVFPATANVVTQQGSVLGFNPPNSGSAQSDHDLPITTSILNLDKAFPFSTNTTSGTGTAFPRNRWLVSWLDLSTIRTSFWRSTGGSADTSDKYWQVVAFPDPPDAPTVTPETADQNPDLTGSTYASSGTHLNSDWTINTTADCEAGTRVWESIDDGTNLESTVVNTTNGSFIGPLAGQTELAVATTYYACARYENEDGDSSWSTPEAFLTSAVIDWSACRTEVGKTEIPANQTSADFTLATSIADTSKAFLIHRATADWTGNGADDHLVSGYILDNDTIRFEREAAATVPAHIGYSIVECMNDEFTVERGEIVLDAAEQFDTATVAAKDATRSMVIVNQRSTDNARDHRESLVYGYMPNTTTVRAERSGAFTPQVTVRYEVVEFSVDSGVTVQSNQINFTGNVASTAATITSSPLNRSWAYCSYDVDTNITRAASVGCELTNDTTITAHRYTATNYTNRVQFYVVTFPAGEGITAQHGSVIANDPNCTFNAQCNEDTTLPTPIASTTKAFPFLTNTHESLNTYYTLNLWIPYWNTETTLRNSFWTSIGTFDLNDKYWQVVEFPEPTIPPDAPSVTYAEGGAVNPGVTTSAYSGPFSHVNTDWKIVETADCTAGASVWESLNDASNLEATTVNTTNGSFVGTLSGQTALASATNYYACARHENVHGDSSWSAPQSFSTTATIDWSACRTEVGTAQIASGSTSVDHTLTTSLTSTTKSFLTHHSTANWTANGADDHLVSGYILDNDTIRFEREAGPAAPAEIGYSIVECFFDEFAVQRGEIVLDAAEQFDTASIAAADPTRSMVIVSQRSNDTDRDHRESLVFGTMPTTTTVRAERSGAFTPEVTVRYQVVQFSAASAVQVNPTQVNFTGNVASTSATIPSSPVNRSWAYCSYDVDTNITRAASVGCELTNATTVTAHRYTATNYTNRVQFYVVVFPASSGITAQQGSILNHDPNCTFNAQCDHDITVTTPVNDVAKAFPYFTNTHESNNTYYTLNLWIASWLNVSTIRTSFWTSTGTLDLNDKYWQVVEFPALGSAPGAPSITSVEAEDLNPDVVASIFAGPGTHSNTDWKVVTTADCNTGISVWEDNNDATNLETVTVNNTTGAFVGPLTGQTALITDTQYYMCARYENSVADSNWSAAFGFTTNMLPDASLASIEGGAASFNLTAGATTTLTGTAVITDNDTCQDISSVTAVVYRTGAGAAGADDDNLRYTMTCTESSGSCTGPTDLQATYSCTADIEYFADGTDAVSNLAADDWTMDVIASDEVGTGDTASDTIEMGSLVAVDTTSVLNFGTLSPGADTGVTNQLVGITNLGNTRLDIMVSDYGVVAADGLSMSCAVGTIPDANLKYDGAAFTYSSGGTGASSTAIEYDLDLDKSTGAGATTSLYTGYAVPNANEGLCTGFLQLAAVHDQAAD